MVGNYVRDYTGNKIPVATNRRGGKPRYTEEIPAFDSLPPGLKPDEVKTIIEEFKNGNFGNRNYFIHNHMRLAINVAFSYGLRNNIQSDLLDVALHELCRFPDLVAEGRLKDNNVIRYMLSRIHCACKDFISTDRTFGPSRGYIAKTGKTMIRHDMNSPEVRDLGYDAPNIDLRMDLESCCETSGELSVLRMILDGYSDVEIRDRFGWKSSTSVNKTINKVLQRYKESVEE